MPDELQVVFFQDRHGVGLGAVRGVGPKNAVLIDEQGEVHRLRHSRTLHVLAARLRADDPPALRERLRALRRELAAGAEGLDMALLDAALTDERRYTLGELATLYYGEASDQAVARLVAALDGPEGWITAGLRVEQGEIVRLDAETRARIREQRAREAEKRRQEDALAAWYEPRRGAPGRLAEAPEDPAAAARLDALRAYALQGDRAPEAAWSRHLARRLGLDGPDAVLAELERGGALPPHVNETPHRLGLPLEFTDHALSAAAAAAPPTAGEDLRARYAVAIDDPETREVDDALTAWPEGDDVWVAVHIARLTELVAPDGPLDREALRRATSVYFPEEVVPMLPPAVGDLASLVAGEDRAAVTLVARITPSGDVAEARFTASLVRIGARLGYDEAPRGEAADVLEHAVRAATALREARRRRGAVLLSLPQLKMRVGAEGAPQVKSTRVESASHLAVSELMVLFNAQLGRALRDAQLPALFRTQPKAVKAPGHDPADPLYPPLCRRGLPPTIVSVEPGPHRMLGVDVYVQGTSPIRRASDLLAQRQLLAHLSGAPAPYDRAAMERLKAGLEAAEKRAQRAMDERERYWLVEWFARRAEPLQAVVSRVDGRGGLMVYAPEVDRELPLRQASPPPRVGDRLLVRVARAAPRERSVVLEAL
ncbi:MAG: RNB domain-containing ribonuclease [Planctomycetes bacterium]|nr:RNB domain-containing ribonuclease [Planctomycetota bacterium]